MTRDVQLLLKDRNMVFRSGDRELYSAARLKLKSGIRDAKAAYRRRIESHFEDSNPRRAWQGIRQITNYKYSTNQNTNSSAPLPDQLNHFFSRFEVKPVRQRFLALGFASVMTASGDASFTGTGPIITASALASECPEKDTPLPATSSVAGNDLISG
ncbi:hypothetical protein AAFF_G00089900 [Aldrovandia affinis]|uniref:Uncharacterized protein n=1 Tax=Aldrovandia affinis TaxID=143900 RepID=A0AAD7RW48_9TELE|nr:hypothetical protein AAFF_G00089900 [Aldrovandia affinis]